MTSACGLSTDKGDVEVLHMELLQPTRLEAICSLTGASEQAYDVMPIMVYKLQPQACLAAVNHQVHSESI